MVKTEDLSSAAHCPAYRKYIAGGDDANNMYVVRSKQHRRGYAAARREICKAAPAKEKSIMWYSKREIKSRRRIAKYKLYSMEAKMKDSFNKGYRWLKRTIVHGF
nr:uncharacterized protein LOC109181282 [Ipomoea batatas]